MFCLYGLEKLPERQTAVNSTNDSVYVAQYFTLLRKAPRRIISTVEHRAEDLDSELVVGSMTAQD